MNVLFAVSGDESGKNDIVDAILKEYQREYQKIISYKRVYYYKSILNEIEQTRDHKYDLIVISEDLEKSLDNSYEGEDATLYRRLDEITDEAYKEDGTGIPVILLCSDRRIEGDPIVKQLFTLGVYNILIGKERTIQNVCSMIEHPRNKKTAKIQYNINPNKLTYQTVESGRKISDRELVSVLRFFNKYKQDAKKCERAFKKLSIEYDEDQLQIIVERLPLDIRLVLEEYSKEYQRISKGIKRDEKDEIKTTLVEKNLGEGKSNYDVIIPD